MQLFLSLAIVALGALEVSAGLGKPALFPNGLGTPLKKLNNMRRAPTKARKNNVPVPQICKDHAKDAGCNVSKVTARRVQYDDCAEPWTLCRCADANLSMDQLETRFSRVPPGIRSYVGGILAIKQNSCSGLNYGGEFIRILGPCGVSVFLHESGHSVDKGMSGSKAFHDAVAKDGCVPDDYSNASYAEDWTQNNVCLTYTHRFGALKKVSKKNPQCMHRQIQLLRGNKRIKEAQSAKKCLPAKRPFHLKRDLEEFNYARELMPEPHATFENVQACNFNETAVDEPELSGESFEDLE